MTKIEQAAKALAGENMLTLTDKQIMDAAHSVGIDLVGRWHLTRIRSAHVLLGLDSLLAEVSA
jgi:hypothetical protein